MAINKVLVVDDSPTDLAHLRDILSDTGCAVVTASSGTESLQRAKADKPDIIFMDIIMPDMDGYEACRLLNEDSATKHIPVVFVTSKGEKADEIVDQLKTFA